MQTTNKQSLTQSDQQVTAATQPAMPVFNTGSAPIVVKFVVVIVVVEVIAVEDILVVDVNVVDNAVVDVVGKVASTTPAKLLR